MSPKNATRLLALLLLAVSLSSIFFLTNFTAAAPTTISSTSSPTTTISTSTTTGATQRHSCFKHTDPMNPNTKIPIACDAPSTAPALSMKLRSKLTRDRLKNFASMKNVAAASSGTATTNGSTGGAPGFVLTFACIPAGAAVCDKAKTTFQDAFAILEDTLSLNAPVNVNATFLDFCTTMGQCGSDGFQILGGAAPERSIVLEGDDNVKRAYPQALVKQMNVGDHPSFGENDIFAQFNAAANFHFPSDTTPIQSSQSDFLFVVLHEMIHGLGFTSAWDDYINDTPKALTPGISGFSDSSGQFQFEGFVENIFDKFMIDTTTNQPMSQRTATLNQWAASNSKPFQSVDAFAAAVTSSDAYTTIGTQVLGLATKAGALTFRPTTGSQDMLLETSLSPYSTGSSVSHADLKTFSNTADYLMRFRVDPGMSLDQATKIGGGGPIGPVLVTVLESLGYATKANPNPSVTARLSPGSPVSSASTVTTTRMTTALGLCVAVAVALLR